MRTPHRRLRVVALVALSAAGAALPARGQERALPDRVELAAFPAGDALVGIGAFNVVKREGTDALGVTQSYALLAGNLGAGVKWYAVRGWGLRGDYRILLIQRNDTASDFFGGLGTRYGHRLYAAAFAAF
jgi:hypothetical protein